MKNKIIYLTLILSMFCFTSCLNDNGNYNYIKKNEVTVTGLDKYSSIYYQENVTIGITVKSEQPNTSFKYEWYINQAPNGDNLHKLSETKDLDFYADFEPGQYKIVLKVTEVEKGLAHFFNQPIEIKTKFTRGWYVLKDDGANTELDLFSEEGNVENILATVSKVGKMKGTATAFTYHPNYWENDENGKSVKSTVLWLQSEYDTKMLNIGDMSVRKERKDLSFGGFDSKEPMMTICIPGFITESFASLKNIYKRASYGGSGKYDAMALEGNRDYEIGAYAANNLQDVVYYDNKNCRFLKMPYNGNELQKFGDKNSDGSTPQFLPNNTNSTLVYMCHKGRIPAERTEIYAILKDKTSAKYRLYTLATKAPFPTANNPFTSVSEIIGDKQIYKSSVFANNSSLKMIYFAIDNNLYYYQIDGGEEVKINLNLPEAEKITFVRDFYISTRQVLVRNSFIIATHNASTDEYKIYLYPEILSGEPTGVPEILRGRGRVANVLLADPSIDKQIINGAYN